MTEGESTTRGIRWRAALGALAASLVLSGGGGLAALVWMRECSTGGTVAAVVATAAAAVVATAVLALTGRATAGRVALVAAASWFGFWAADHACNRPDEPTEQYLRSLGPPGAPPPTRGEERR